MQQTLVLVVVNVVAALARVLVPRPLHGLPAVGPQVQPTQLERCTLGHCRPKYSCCGSAAVIYLEFAEEEE